MPGRESSKSRSRTGRNRFCRSYGARRSRDSVEDLYRACPVTATEQVRGSEAPLDRHCFVRSRVSAGQLCVSRLVLHARRRASLPPLPYLERVEREIPSRSYVQFGQALWPEASL